MRDEPDTARHGLSEEAILALGNPLARVVEFYPEIPSTQSRAVELARAGVRGAVVVSGIQTGGRGRLGNDWSSPEGGLWMSVVVSPSLPAERAPRITQSASVAVAKALREFGAEASIKWPNDLLVQGRKICGVLAESSTSFNPRTGQSELDFAVLGIGVNANLDATEFPVPEGGLPATSLRRERGEDVVLVSLLDSILNHLGVELARASDFRQTLADLRSLSCTLGRRVRVRRRGTLMEGTATDVTSEGALILATETGLHELLEGDVEHLRESNRETE